MDKNGVRWVHRKIGDDDIYYERKSRTMYRGTLSHKINTEKEIVDLSSSDPRAPLKVYFDPSYYCNLNCRHCITNSSVHADTSNQLPTKRIITIMDELATIGVLELSVGGGEPLCYSDLYSILKHMVALGFNVVLDTNGVLVTSSIATSLADIGLSEIRISFEGCEQVNDSIRGQGVYKKALQAVKILTYVGLTIVPRLTLCIGSELGLDQLFKDLVFAGAKVIKVSTVKRAGRASLPENQNLLGYPININTVISLQELGKKYGIEVLFPVYFPVSPKETDGGELRYGNHMNCGAGFETAYISPYGEIHPCSSMPQVNFGILTSMSFMDAWTSKIANDYRHLASNCACFQLCTMKDVHILNNTGIAK